MDLALANPTPTQSRARNLVHFVAFLVACLGMALNFSISVRVDDQLFVPAIWLVAGFVTVAASTFTWWFSNTSGIITRWRKIATTDLLVAAWYFYTMAKLADAAAKGIPKDYDGSKEDLEWVSRRLGVFAAVSGVSSLLFFNEALVASGLYRWISRVFPALAPAPAPVNIPLVNLPPLLQFPAPAPAPRIPMPALPGRLRLDL